MTETTHSGKHETEWITISLDEYDSMRRTIEVLSDRGLMRQLEKGKDRSKTREFEDLARDLGI